MRILYHHRIASRDGQFVHVEELTSALRRLGHEVQIVGPSATTERRGVSASRWVGGLKRWVPRAPYELSEYAYAVFDYRRLALAARRFLPDCVYERYNLFLPSGVWLRRRRGLPLLLEVNAPLWHERCAYGGIALSRLARSTEVTAWRGADFVLPVTRVLADHVAAAGVPRSRIVVIPNGIDPALLGRTWDAAEAKRRLGLEGRLVLGFTGFVREWHRLDRAIDCLAGETGGLDPVLLIVGDGPDRGRLEALARQRGVGERVRFTGRVERTDVARHVAAFDVALQPAVVPYASPLKLFEYLALGRTVVAPATPNIREIVTDEQDALLFDPEDAAAFRAAVLRACRDEALRGRLGGAARRLVERRGLTWDSNARRVIELYRRLGVADGPAAASPGAVETAQVGRSGS